LACANWLAGPSRCLPAAGLLLHGATTAASGADVACQHHRWVLVLVLHVNINAGFLCWCGMAQSLFPMAEVDKRGSKK